jgi:hypothetical protein
MSVTSSDGVSMRVLCAFVLAAFLWVLSSALGGDGAMALAQFIRPSSVSEPPLVLEAAFVCGMFDGKFGCKSAPGGVDHGKNATPGIPSATPDASPGVTGDTTNPAAATYGAGNAGQGSQSGLEEKETAKPGEHSCPPGYRVLAVPTKFGYCEPPGGTPAADATCQHGMVGTPPNNCHCPKNSELLGGNCVHYSATCRSGLAADSIPQPCQGADEKLACKTRQDGLKDCCCLTYDKL